MSEVSPKRLTSSEIGSLWTTYMQNSLSQRVLSYFLGHVQDTDIKPHVQTAYNQAVQNLDTIRDIFSTEEIPVPFGFSEQDVNVQAARLFEDTFFLIYLKQMGKAGLPQYGLLQSMANRQDVNSFFSSCLTNTSNLFYQVNETLLSKGLLIRSPHIPTPKKNEFIQDKNYFDGNSLMGKKRPLNAIEISHLYSNIQTNVVGSMLAIGFGQTAKSQKIRDYMDRGKDIAQKHIRVFGDLLLESDLLVPMTWDASATDSTDHVFSDKLMMFHFSMLMTGGLGNYGAAIATSPRSDLGLKYTRLSAEIAKYAKEGANIMVENGWFEEPPQAADRTHLM